MKIENLREKYHQTLEDLTEGDAFTFVDDDENETFFMKLSLKDIALPKLSQKVITDISQLLERMRNVCLLIFRLVR